MNRSVKLGGDWTGDPAHCPGPRPHLLRQAAQPAEWLNFLRSSGTPLVFHTVSGALWSFSSSAYCSEPKEVNPRPRTETANFPHVWGPFGRVPQHILGKRPRCHGDALSRFLRARPGTIICRVRGFGFVA